MNLNAFGANGMKSKDVVIEIVAVRALISPSMKYKGCQTVMMLKRWVSPQRKIKSENIPKIHLCGRPGLFLSTLSNVIGMIIYAKKTKPSDTTCIQRISGLQR